MSFNEPRKAQQQKQKNKNETTNIAIIMSIPTQDNHVMDFKTTSTHLSRSIPGLFGLLYIQINYYDFIQPLLKVWFIFLVLLTFVTKEKKKSLIVMGSQEQSDV